MKNQIEQLNRTTAAAAVEQIPQELVEKFDNDKELVQEFLAEGHSMQDLQNSTITHPTKYDPAVMLDNESLGFWIDNRYEDKYLDDNDIYSSRKSRYF